MFVLLELAFFAGKCISSSVRSAVCISGRVGQQHNSTGCSLKQLRNAGRGFASKSSNKRYTVTATSGLITILWGTEFYYFRLSL